MNIIYNCFAGISGDMNLAAMLDLGMDPDLLRSELAQLGVDNEYELEVYPAAKSGINGTQVKVILKNQHHEHHHHGEHHGEHSHAHHHHHHHSRNYSDIAILIDNSTLDASIKTLSKKIFWEVALAEGKVHDKAPEDVHFHEVGATDSIVDIVGAAICYHHLKITQVTTTVPELGGGFVKCQHGKMPVPAPATTEILKGIKCSTGAVDKEMTTPTGAAILKVLTDVWAEHPTMNVLKTAYGIGHREVDIPNVLRVYEVKPSPQIITQKSIMIACNIDDMTAEEVGLLPDLLLRAGASDAFLSPIIMKKGRPATQVSVLCKEDKAEELSALLFRHSSTIGLRSYTVNKTELPREDKTLNTPWGDVRYKESILPDGSLRRKVEFDDLKAIAEKENQGIAEIRRAILKLF